MFREELAITRNPPAKDVDLSDPAAAAREEGLSKRQLMAKQEKALKDAEEAKRKEAKKKAAEETRKTAEEKNKKADADPAAVAHEEGVSKSVHGATRQQLKKSTLPGANSSTFDTPVDKPPSHHFKINDRVQHRNAPPQVPQEYNALVGSSNPYNLAVGSTVQVATINPNDPPHYGVIRWTGSVAGVDGQVAGIELVSKESIV